jgi:hypothetical protein
MSYSLDFYPEIKFYARRDRTLWRQLKDRCGNISFISTPEQFKNYLESSFKEITGYNIGYNEPEDGCVYVEKLDNKKDISSGIVKIQWWKTIGVPVLVKRFTVGKSPYTEEDEFVVEKLGKLKNSSFVLRKPMPIISENI